MFIAKIENSEVVQVVDSREIFGTSSPSIQQLIENSFMQVNLWRDHDKLTQKLVPCTPVIDGAWVYTMAVQNLSEEEIQSAKDSAMSQIREIRNKLLKDSDYTQIPDNPGIKKSDWVTYRQILRDLPSNITGDPRMFNEWPNSPDWQPI